ncbi:carboxypeptidase B [Latimeria chalumnae]|uniref:Carboxypeptidase B n=1 Tax=Latimeria chalumnae TaxID=7897 RepID=H3ABR6_LATCH|nr:PREDICTED: carboxypeptidase B [Latimeria chalumnae]|eukprot:XP_006007910.1 PREDICTED: carboxypeptidase B [Latimeria chalumnae]
MKALLILGFIAAALAEPSIHLFSGEKVFRLKLENEEQLGFIQNLVSSVKVDFWHPDSVNQLALNMDVDFHVEADQSSYVQDLLEQSGLQYKVLIDDLQSVIEEQFDNYERSTVGHSYFKYNTWDKIADWTASITAENPNLISRTQIGSTYEGRPMYLLKVGQCSQEKKAIFMDCGFHAREWISPAFCQWFVKEAVRTYGTDKLMTRLLDQLDFYVLPVLNIDGYVYSWTNNRMWRKTRSRNSNSKCFGTDLNRNFDSGWCTVGASKNPCDDTYCGSAPESEAEAKAVANFIRSNLATIKSYLTIHSYSQMLLYPYSYTYAQAANTNELNILSKAAVRQLSTLYGTRYTYGPGATTIYPAAGGSDDWAYDEGIKYSFTFELRDTGRYGFLLPESQIQPTCEETMLAVKYIANYVLDNLY